MAHDGHRQLKAAIALLLMVALGALIAVLAWRFGHKIWLVFARYSMWDRCIVEAARRNNVDPRLVKAVVWRESRFRPDALGLAGEVGLMQIRPGGAVADWARANGVEPPPVGALFTPELNIEIGSWYLGKAVRKWAPYKGCFELSLCEYNAGSSRSNSWRPLNPDDNVVDNISISSTRAYVTSIMAKYNEYVKEWKPQGLLQDQEGKKRK